MSMTMLEGSTYAAVIAWVEGLVAASPKLQATKHDFYTLDGRVWIKVEGGAREAHAWHVAVGGHMMPSHIDRNGVRRQIILGVRAHAEIIDDPRAHSEGGAVHLVLLCAVAGVGLAAWGWTHPAEHPTGDTVAGALPLSAAFGLLWMLRATIRGYRRLEGSGQRRTTKRLEATRQTEGNAHHQDAAS